MKITAIFCFHTLVLVITVAQMEAHTESENGHGSGKTTHCACKCYSCRICAIDLIQSIFAGVSHESQSRNRADLVRVYRSYVCRETVVVLWSMNISGCTSSNDVFFITCLLIFAVVAVYRVVAHIHGMNMLPYGRIAVLDSVCLVVAPRFVIAPIAITF